VPGWIASGYVAGDRRRALCIAGLAGRTEPVDIATPHGARSFSVTLQDGRTLAVISTPGAPGPPAPLADDLPDLARDLALRAS
jgi:hypothetical protein